MAKGRGLIIAAVGASLMVAGCETTPSTGQTVGTVGGAGIGATIGYFTLHAAQGTAIGAAVGAIVGLGFGTYIDPPARPKVAEAVRRAFDDAQTGEAIEWTGGRSAGSVTPLAEQYADHDRTCRTLHQDETWGGQHYVRDISACQSKDGLLEITEAPGEG